jgi:hypothetical protein
VKNGVKLSADQPKLILEDSVHGGSSNVAELGLEPGNNLSQFRAD